MPTPKLKTAAPHAEMMKTRARRDGLTLLLLGSMVFLLLGAALEHSAPAPMVDFKVLYYPARCLLQHRDPYRESQVLSVYRTEGVFRAPESEKVHEIITRYLYLPTAFSLTVPFALLPWGPAHLLWTALTAASLIFASYLVWDLAADYAPVLAGALIGLLLANSELLMISGNAAGIAVSLCAIAVWCFVCGRFVWAGIVCFALSLALKPHDVALVWLYFLLAGGVYRQRALKTLLAAVAIGLPPLLWVGRASPHWIGELHANLLSFTGHGGINDPSLASTGAHGLAMLISLQAVTGVLWSDPRIYNAVSYLVCAPLLLAWALKSWRARSTAARTWLALASIAALSLLPIYHRQYDATLLLLTVPACALLWAEDGALRWWALAVNSAALLCTGDLSWAIFLGLIGHLRGPAVAAQVAPAPLILLATAVFYLWFYLRRAFAGVPA